MVLMQQFQIDHLIHIYCSMIANKKQKDNHVGEEIQFIRIIILDL